MKNHSDLGPYFWNKDRLLHEHSMRMDTDQKLHFELRPTDDSFANLGSKRAELKDPRIPAFGETMQYRLSFTMPSQDLSHLERSVVIAQWYSSAGLYDRRPVLALRVSSSGKLRLSVFHDGNQEGSGHVIFEEPFELGKPYDLKLDVTWGAETSQITGEMDGKAFTYEGKAGYPSDKAGPFMKIGLYTTGKFTEPLKITYDSVKRQTPASALQR